MSEFRQVVVSCLMQYHLLLPLIGYVMDYAAPGLLLLMSGDESQRMITIGVYNPEIRLWKTLKFDEPKTNKGLVRVNWSASLGLVRNKVSRTGIITSRGIISPAKLRSLALTATTTNVSIVENDFQWLDPSEVWTCDESSFNWKFHFSPTWSFMQSKVLRGTYIITHNQKGEIHDVPEPAQTVFSNCIQEVTHLYRDEPNGFDRFYMIYVTGTSWENVCSRLVYLPLKNNRPDPTRYQWIFVDIPSSYLHHYIGRLDEQLILVCRKTCFSKHTCFTCTPEGDQHKWQPLPPEFDLFVPQHLFIDTV